MHTLYLAFPVLLVQIHSCVYLGRADKLKILNKSSSFLNCGIQVICIKFLQFQICNTYKERGIGMILNGKKIPPNAEQRFNAAVDEIIRERVG